MSYKSKLKTWGTCLCKDYKRTIQVPGYTLCTESNSRPWKHDSLNDTSEDRAQCYNSPMFMSSFLPDKHLKKTNKCILYMYIYKLYIYIQIIPNICVYIYKQTVSPFFRTTMIQKCTQNQHHRGNPAAPPLRGAWRVLRPADFGCGAAPAKVACGHPMLPTWRFPWGYPNSWMVFVNGKIPSRNGWWFWGFRK